MVINADIGLLADLEPEAAKALDKHYASTKEWHPHLMVPWGRGRDFESDYEWSPEESEVPADVRSALYVNLLTEDNLPYYFRDIERMLGREGAWGEWTRRWTAEEGRHAIVIRDYLTVTRAIDPNELERGRMIQMGSGQVPEPTSAVHGLAYVTLQELATRISHRNTGTKLEDKVGYDIMRRVAIDENHHFLFYRDMTTACLNADPSRTVQAIADEVIGFAMPGEGIPNFYEHAKVIANAGIYNLALHHEQILDPIVMKHWDIANITGLSPEAQEAQDKVVRYIEKSARVAKRISERMEAKAAAGVDA